MEDLIVLTGGTGWVGRNFLHELQKIFPASTFNNNVLVFGSKKNQIISTAYTKNNQIFIPIYPLSSIKNKLKTNKNLKIIHCAFLTRDKINKYGLKKYVDINRQISNTIYEILYLSRNSKAIIVSSGAARLFDKENLTNEMLNKNPYEYLKYEEEEKLSKVTNSLTLRIFALSGYFIRDPNLFALGNFLISAKLKKPISINALNNVIRSYGFASDIAKSAIKWLLNTNNSEYDNKKIDVISHTTNLLNLAKEITQIYDLPNIKENINYSLVADDYSSESNLFLNFLKAHNMESTPMKTQIKETMKSIFIENL